VKRVERERRNEIIVESSSLGVEFFFGRFFGNKKERKRSSAKKKVSFFPLFSLSQSFQVCSPRRHACCCSGRRPLIM
jgi:hypothetical protein